MKYHDCGSLFTVSYSNEDAREFRGKWLCSSVTGSGSFQFQKSNGDLVDTTGSATEGDGPDWLEFSQDCKKYGTEKGKEMTVRLTSTDLKVSHHPLSQLEQCKDFVHNLGGSVEVLIGGKCVEVKRAEARVVLTFGHAEDAERFLFVLNQLLRNACGKRSITNSLRRLARLAVVILQKL